MPLLESARMRRTLVSGLAWLTVVIAGITAGTQPAAEIRPLDPQRVQDQQEMTWADYRPIPGVNWADPSLVAQRKLRVALVAVDFPDQPFVITVPKQSDLFGNPQIDPIPRADVAKFYRDFLGTPSPINHGQTINGYWMEQSRGKVGIAPDRRVRAVPDDEEPVSVRPQRMGPGRRLPRRLHVQHADGA